MAIIHLKNTPSDGAYVMFEGREMSKPVDGLESVVRPLTIARDHEYVFNDVSEKTPLLERDQSKVSFCYDEVLSIDGRIRMPGLVGRGFSANVIEKEQGKYLVASPNMCLDWASAARSYKILEVLGSLPSLNLYLNPEYRSSNKKTSSTEPREPIDLKKMIERISEKSDLNISIPDPSQEEEIKKIMRDFSDRENYPLINLAFFLVQHYESMKKTDLDDATRQIIGRVGIPGVELPSFAKHPEFATLGNEKLLELLNAVPKDANGNLIQEGEHINILIASPELPDEKIKELLQTYR